jgi:hypothetical protein
VLSLLQYLLSIATNQMQLGCPCFSWLSQAINFTQLAARNVFIGLVKTACLEGVVILRDWRYGVGLTASDTHHGYQTKTFAS